MSKLTKREEYIKKTFFSKTPSKYADELVKKISDIGRSIGFIGVNINQDESKSEKRKHKYDVWISKEVKKDVSIIDKVIELRLIIDWASETNADIFKFNFEQAYLAQETWHEDMRKKHLVEDLDIPSIDEDRIIFRFSDKEHFLYLLNSDDLSIEGKLMGHCVGGSNYKSKLKNKQSLIFSIRDRKNIPHVTIEVDVKSRTTIQKFGKGNKPPTEKYMQMYCEYALYASDFKDIRNREVLRFLNIDFLNNNH
jgi:hypothetical protein